MGITGQQRMIRYFSLVLGASVGVLLTGCDQSCDADATCVPEGWPWSTSTEAGDGCPADPADGPVEPRCGVWVSATLGLDSSPGTQDSPVKTLHQAIEVAKSGSRRVYACGETFAESVRVPSGVSLFGGFDCQHEWQYGGIEARAKIASLPGAVALVFQDADEEMIVGDVEVHAAGAPSPGGSSIAVLVQQQARGSLVRADIFAGNGADGANGEDGDPYGLPAPKGLPGDNGMDACVANIGLGGLPGIMQCPGGAPSTGGPGGDGGASVAGNGADGTPAPQPNPGQYGAGGKGEQPVQNCTGGQGGEQGAPGQDGIRQDLAATARISNEGILVGGDGGDGTSGLPGQGGGGGGGSVGGLACGAGPHGGAGGGGGGAGGCGGRRGKGGQAGGSSIGLVVLGSAFSFYGVRVTTGNGGNGGRGGASQQGGQGGLPGYGGLGFGAVDGVAAGCTGGAGGPGGNGGAGAGGRGGYSVAFAWVGLNEWSSNDHNKVVLGYAGHGGMGGNPDSWAQIGADGARAPNYLFDPW